MDLRQFNQEGIKRFRKFLAACRQDGTIPVPRDLLEDDELTQSVSPSIEIMPQQFQSKEDAARYLMEALSPIDKKKIRSSVGIWTWLSLFYFDQVCPIVSGSRKVRNDYTYIFEPDSMRNSYRHLLYISWRILDVAPQHNRLFLTSKINVLDAITSEVMKRLYLIRIPCIFEVLDRLYWDDDLQRPKIGVVDSKRVKAGDLSHRLPVRIRQLEKTYDLYSLDCNQLLELLGTEFSGEQITL